MKCLKTLILGSLLFVSAAYADGFGFGFGPFDLQFNTGDEGYEYQYKSVLDDPICSAISHQQQLEMILQTKETVSSKEIKIVTKRIVIEPYAFGITNDGKPVLNGNVITEELIKEVNVKYGEDRFNEASNQPEQKEKGFFSGWFSSDKTKNIDIQQVSGIRVVGNSHFDAPKNYKGLKNDKVRVICQLPIAS